MEGKTPSQQGTRVPRGQGGGACESGVCGEESLLVRGLQRDSRQGDTRQETSEPLEAERPRDLWPGGQRAVAPFSLSPEVQERGV